jgi:Leucine-rich repeat (LRR) protein
MSYTINLNFDEHFQENLIPYNFPCVMMIIIYLILNNLFLLFQTCSLTILNASYNEITFLPETIAHMKVMEDLNFAHNQIEKLPDEITGFKLLEVINVRN